MVANASNKNKKQCISASTDSILIMLISNYTFSGMLRQCVRSLDRLEVIIA